MKLVDIQKSAISAIFPFVGLFLSNRVIRKKIKDKETTLENIEDSKKIKTEVLKNRYEDTIKSKDKFEDKAKSQIFAITVAVTVIFGASSLLKTVSDKYSSTVVNWLVFTLYLSAIVFLIIAGILAIRMLMHENIIYTINLKSYIKEEDLRNELDVATNDNIKRNQLRNNYIFTSYECIRNALICLFIVLIIAIIPIRANTASSLADKGSHEVVSHVMVLFV